MQPRLIYACLVQWILSLAGCDTVQASGGDIRENSVNSDLAIRPGGDRGGCSHSHVRWHRAIIIRDTVVGGINFAKGQDYMLNTLYKIGQFSRSYPVPVIALLGMLAGAVLHYLHYDEAGHTVWFATLVVGGIPVVWHTVRETLRRHFVSDIVALMAIVASIILNDAFPGVVIVLMQSGGKALEDYAYKRATYSLDALLSRAPRIAHKQTEHGIEEVNVPDIVVGDILAIRQGDLVPVDGKVLDGPARIDESSLTGEPLPKTKAAGEQVFSGTVNIGESFQMTASRKSDESQYAKIVQLVQKAQQEKAPIQRLADRYAVWFTPITLAVSFIGWLVTGSYQTILSVLVVATPCSLIFATPVAIIGGINRAAKEGIIVKRAAAIEQTSNAQVVVFDKTGTITLGTPTVERIVSFDGLSSDEILLRASSLEQLSSHPIAEMIAHRGLEKFGSLPLPRNFREISGAGVEGDVDSDHVIVGAPSIFEKLGVDVISYANSVSEKIGPEGRMVAFVGVNGRLAGAIIFGDRMRPGVPAMMQKLQASGVGQTVMLTGDIEENARSIAAQAGIAKYEAELVPEEKVLAVKKLRQHFDTVVMVGDGINDAPALAASTVGIAMGARGTAVSAEAADIVLLVDDVSKVSSMIEIGKRTIKVAKQSIAVGLGCSFFLMGVATLGHLEPAVGALLQEVLDVAVILNALRAR